MISTEKKLTQFSHEIWTTDDGLPQNSVNKIVQTPDGYLWLGTQEGLVRFDGVQFTVFDKHNTPQIKNNYISSLHVDRSGKLWIGTYDGGLISYYNNKFIALGGIKKFANSHIRAIYEDSQSGLWVSIRGRGVMRIDTATHRSFDTTNGLVSNEAWNFCEDSRGGIWIATENGVSIYENNSFRSYTVNDGLPSSSVNAIVKGQNNTMWLATHQGIQRVPIDLNNKASVVSYNEKEGLPNRIVYDIQIDNQGSIWIGTRNGIARLQNKKISPFTSKDGLSYDHVGAIFVDYENNIWVGTDGGGLNVLKDGIFTSYTTKEGLLSNIIWTIYEDKDHAMWIGTDGGLIKMTHDQKISMKYFTANDGLYDNEVYSLYKDNSDAMWVGTVNGINKIVNNKVLSVDAAIKSKGLIISHVFGDSKGRIWVATTGEGIYLLDKGKVRIYNLANGFPSNYISCIAEDKNGNIYVGSDGEGIAIISEEKVERLTTENGLSSNFVHSIYVDNEQVVWAGTFGGGLNRIVDSKIKAIMVKNGLHDDLIFQILEDNFGRLWMTSNRGIFHINKDMLHEFADGKIQAVVSVTYSKADGLRSTECNGGVQPAGWKAHDGSLWFPTAEGVAVIDPKNITVNKQPPFVVMEDVVIDNQLVREAIIPPGHERYEFRFTGISFANPKNIRFKVKLEGYDKQWDDIGTRRAAYYTHLPPGEYTLRVLAANSDGIWNETGVSYPFIVQARFYETNIFFISISILFVMGSYASYRWRIRQITKRQLELERIVDERTKNLSDANNAKSQLLSFVAHDLKTPLITINSIAQEIKAFENIDSHFRGYLDLVEQNSKRIVTLISEILNITAIESGKFQFTFEPISIAEVAALVVDGYHVQARRKDQTIKYTVDPTHNTLVMADSTKIQEAMENLVNNAVKYSPRNAHIDVQVEQKNNIVYFSVKDQGPGVAKNERELLFKKFQVLSAKPTGGEIATGLGLAIVKEIVEAHKGKIFVESDPPKGSTFIIELPRIEN